MKALILSTLLLLVGCGYKASVASKVTATGKVAGQELVHLWLPEHDPLVAKYGALRQDAVRIVETHIAKHTDCILSDVLPYLKAFKIVFVISNAQIVAAEVDGAVWVNLKQSEYRTNTFLQIMLVHEALHASGMCGEDASFRPEPRQLACVLWDEPIMWTHELTAAVEKHLKDDLNNYSRRKYERKKQWQQTEIK
jgi:hypothetical protein